MLSIKLALVDDHEIFRRGLKFLFRKYKEMDVIMEAENGKELAEQLSTSVSDGIDIPEIILLDIDMPVMDGYETAAFLKKNYSHIKIIVITHHNSEQILRHLIKLGVCGFLLKNCNIESIVDSIHGVIKNGYYFNEKVSGATVRRFMKSGEINPKFDKAHLSERELEILLLICDEKNNIEIADALNIDTTTVNAHKKNIIRKTETKNIIGAVMYAVKQGLLE